MSEENKTLQETVSTVIEKPKANLNAEITETKEGMSQETQPVETKSGETTDYVSGIDISDVPEQDRTRIRDLLTKKAKLLEDGYQPKFQEVAKLKKAQEELVNMGLSVDDAYDVLAKHMEKKRNPVQITKDTETKKDAVKTLDGLLKDAPFEQRPALEQMRKIILEETNVGELRKEVADLKTVLASLQGDNATSKQSKVKQFINDLSTKYPKDLVEKYRAEMVNAHLQYNLPLGRLLQSIVPLDELEQAILTRGKKPLTKEKKDAIVSNSSGVTSAAEKIDVKSKSLKGVITDLLKIKK